MFIRNAMTKAQKEACLEGMKDRASEKGTDTVQQASQPIDVYLRALSKVRNAQALTSAEEYAYRNFTPADVIANSMLSPLAGFLQETGLSEDMQDQAFVAGAESLKCPDCKASLTFVGDGVFCRCNDHELQTAGRVEAIRALASVEPPALTESDITDGELLAAKWVAGVIVAVVVVGAVWFHGLGAWVTGLFQGGH